MNVEVQRHPEVSRSRHAKVRRHHAKYGEGPAIEGNCLVDDCRIAGEAFLPEAVTQDCYLVVARFFIFEQEGAPESRLRAQRLEIVSGNSVRFESLRFAVARMVQTRRQRSSKLFEGVVLLAVVEKVEWRDTSAVATILDVS